MFIEIVVTALGALAYIYLLTVLFEFCLNEASSTLLTAAGFLLFILLTVLFAGLVFRLFKKAI